MRTTSLIALVLLVVAGCGGGEEEPVVDNRDYVTVDHILIGVKGPRIPKGLTPEEAHTKAYDLMKQIEAGADWAALKKANSDDPPPGGPYTMANHEIKPRSRDDIPRGMMAQAFGDVSFSLKVGELGMADYDTKTSPFGYHLIKRVK